MNLDELKKRHADLVYTKEELYEVYRTMKESIDAELSSTYYQALDRAPDSATKTKKDKIVFLKTIFPDENSLIISKLVNCRPTYAYGIKVINGIVTDKIGDKSRELHYRRRLRGGIVSKQKRDTILKRDNYECVVCKSKKDLVIHHVIPVLSHDIQLDKYENKYFLNHRAWTEKEKKYHESNLVTLCKRCHLGIHNHNYFEFPWYNIGHFSIYFLLEMMDGVGEKTLEKLYQHFVDADAIQEANIDDLRGLGIQEKTAKRIKGRIEDVLSCKEV